MEIVDEYEKCIGKSDSDESRAKCESRLKGAQGLWPGLRYYRARCPGSCFLTS
ncbi:MAG: hypothetical protein OEU63_03330 [Gammaproteobacteria bacterium]|nr:hypothetical protein [Gammaproteobacteria bacterium]